MHNTTFTYLSSFRANSKPPIHLNKLFNATKRPTISMYHCKKLKIFVWRRNSAKFYASYDWFKWVSSATNTMSLLLCMLEWKSRSTGITQARNRHQTPGLTFRPMSWHDRFCREEIESARIAATIAWLFSCWFTVHANALTSSVHRWSNWIWWSGHCEWLKSELNESNSKEMSSSHRSNRSRVFQR